MNMYDVIKRPIVTEKSNLLKEANATYVFEVCKKADKDAIKNCVEKLFNVKVKGVRTVNQHGKVKRFGSRSMGRTSSFKKAYVTLTEGKIDLFEGV